LESSSSHFFSLHAEHFFLSFFPLALRKLQELFRPQTRNNAADQNEIFLSLDFMACLPLMAFAFINSSSCELGGFFLLHRGLAESSRTVI
jgi:hypothetical protein